MSVLRVSALNVYPIKSCRGIQLSSSDVTTRGLRDDRLFMVVNWQGEFVSQREYPSMALIELQAVGSEWRLSAPGLPPLQFQPSTTGESLEVVVWSDYCQATDQGTAVSDWFSKYLNLPCRLVRISDHHPRLVDRNYAVSPTDQVGFADGFPLLLISTASLADLNDRLGTELSMDRFRPNIVIEGCAPYEEDYWKRIRIGSWECDVVKPCARCTITTVDPLTAVRGKEPLLTLAKYRQLPPLGVIFGQNAIPRGAGRIAVGDDVIAMT